MNTLGQIRPNTMIAVLILWFLLPASASLAGEPAPDGIETDRPDFTESPAVVGPWMLQFEGGITVARDSAGGPPSRSVGGPYPLLRLGLSRFLEFRLQMDGYLRESIIDSTPARRTSGMSDLAIEVKVKLMDEGKVRPMFAVIPELSLPTGSREITSFGYDPAVNFALSKSLPLGFDAGGNVKFTSVTSEGRRFLQRALSLTFGHELFTGTEGFWEVYEISPPERDRPGLWIFDTGLTHALGRNAQIDFAVGRSVRPTTPTWFATTGIAFRVPLHSRLLR